MTHVLVILPFVIAMVSASLANFDWTLQEAAMDLGAGPIRTFFRVDPAADLGQRCDRRAVRLHHVVRPGRDHDLHGATGSNTLPVEMFLYLQKWQDPTIAALSSLLILFAVVLVLR